MSHLSAIFGCAGLQLAPDEARFFAKAQPWGFILFARNIGSAPQIQALCADLRSAVGRDAPILIDQEGGRVQRIRAPLVRGWTPPLDFVAAAGAQAEAAMQIRYQLIAHDLRRLGIDVNCAPMLDIARPDTHAILKNRCYHSDPRRIADIGRAVANGLMAGGCLPIIKHMPGHGASTVDSHLEPPQVALGADTLDQEDFLPFRHLADLPLGMTSHVVYQAHDRLPATFSSRMIGIIRDRIGFQGLLMTDDISMEALSGTPADRSVRALEAGCDLVLHCNGELAQMRAIADAIPRMSKAAQDRADAALGMRPAPQAVDIPALEAKLDALVIKGAHGQRSA